MAHAERIAFLIDGAAYFRALHCALSRARHQVLIVGWDIAPDTRLIAEAADGWPGSLGELLETLLRRRPQLDIHVLVWDARVFRATLPLLPGRRRHWQTRPRLHLRLDDGHPLWGSHHQKIVVIDDRVAFCGGLDITHGRWDTPTHRPDLHPGRHRRAYHDVQLAVDGDAAAALGQLARRRWCAVTGRPPIRRRQSTMNIPGHPAWRRTSAARKLRSPAPSPPGVRSEGRYARWKRFTWT